MALKAADVLKEKNNINAEVLDLRSIRPLDEEAILATVKKTNRVLYVEESKPFCSVGAMVACLIQDKAFDDLDAPVKRLTSIDAPAIYSPPIEKLQLPTVDRIYQAALETLK
jgi:pyruvate dehydrogenase E1 component beta subunit